MTQPAKRNQNGQIKLYLQRQTWALLIVIVVAWLLDSIWLHSGLVIAKSTAIGASLSFMTQVIFAVFTFSYTGFKARKRIVSQFFRGQALKWLVTVVGFAFIFILIKPLSAPALFLGFILMKASHILMLGRMR